MRRVAVLGLAIVLAGCMGGGGPSTSSASQSKAPSGIRLAEVASGLAEPLLVVPVPDAPGRLLVVERAGTVRVLESGQLLPTPFADLTDRVGSASQEQGLLGLAFHPGYAQNRVAVLSYTDKSGNSVLARYHVKDGRLDAGSEEALLRVDQPFENHNGGNVVFGPDGMLYYGLGDGGLRDDPEGNGQNRLALLGKLLRLDVGATGPYKVPPDNPYASDPLWRAEIWDYGLRNPWRFSFDSQTKDLWIADVGQDAWEEVDLESAPSTGGRNYGWNMYEGSHLYRPGTAVDAVMPVAEYPHADGCSITGGFVYRGDALPTLQGAYLYGDFCSGTIWRLDRDGDGWTPSVLLSTKLAVSSFGEDLDHELYVVDLQGTVSRLVAG